MTTLFNRFSIISIPDPPRRGAGARVDAARRQAAARAGHLNSLPEQEQDGRGLAAHSREERAGGDFFSLTLSKSTKSLELLANV